MKRLLIIFLFIATQFAFANEQDRFKQANNAYAEQRYDSALEIYSQLIEDGWQSAAINFNTANCYYRLNSIGKAILYYEKAKHRISINSKSIEAIVAEIRILLH